MTPDVLIIIRSVGERTTELCYQIACQQVPKEDVIILEERPFSNAVKKTFELGANSRKKWTLALDADILLFEDSVSKMINKANQFDDKLFIYQGGVYDKIFCNGRSGGPHLYRSSYLKTALNLIPSDEKELRPESYTYYEMAKKGYKYYFDNIIYGLHDFFQNKKDIFRKCQMHAIKHRKILPKLIDSWFNNIQKDEDYKVMLISVFAKYIYTQDDNNYVNKIFYKYEIKEKESITNNLNEIKSIIKSIKQDYDLRPSDGIYLFVKTNYQINNILKSHLKQLILKLGNKLIRIGNSLN